MHFSLWNAGLEDGTLEQLSKIVLQCTGLKDLCLDGNAYIRKHRYDLLLKEESRYTKLTLIHTFIHMFIHAVIPVVFIYLFVAFLIH